MICIYWTWPSLNGLIINLLVNLQDLVICTQLTVTKIRYTFLEGVMAVTTLMICMNLTLRLFTGEKFKILKGNDLLLEQIKVQALSKTIFTFSEVGTDPKD